MNWARSEQDRARSFPLTGGRGTWRSYAVAVGLVGAALVVRMGLDRWMELESPFLLFLAAIVGAAWYGGLGPGLVATALGAAASDYFFIRPYRDFMLETLPERVRFGLFVAEALIACGLCAALHSARRRAEEEIERSRELEGAVLQISDSEQRRIGLDLHDGLGQHLTGVALLAKALERRVTEESPGAAEEAGRVARLVNEAIGRARDVARGLSPVALETEGLRAALGHLAGVAEGVLGVECVLVWDEGVDVSDPVAAMHMYRIAQEATNNAVKHGRARRVELGVGRLESGEVELSVTDDGTGIAEPPGGDAGMGLRIMEYRARMIGGRLEVGRARGSGGTAVRCVVPADRAGGAIGG